MRRSENSGCEKDALSVLEFLEIAGKYRIIPDRIPSHSNAAAVRPKRSCRARHTRTAPNTEDTRALKIQNDVKLKHEAEHAAKDQAGAGQQEWNVPEGESDGDVELELEGFPIQVRAFEGPVILPAPGKVPTCRRRDVSKAGLEDAQQPNSKRSRKEDNLHGKETPDGVPNPPKAVVASDAVAIVVNQSIDNAVNADHSAIPPSVPANVQGLHDDHVAEVPAQDDPFAQLSLPALNEILEKRLNQRLLPHFQPQEGKSSTATAKQFDREILHNRVEHFKAILKQSTLLTSAHSQIAACLSNLGDPENFPASAKAHLRQDHEAFMALKKLCKKAPYLAEQQVKFAAVMKRFDIATNHEAAAEQDERQLYTRQEMEAGMARAADEREAQVRQEVAARAAAAPEPADPAMLPLPAEVVAANSTNDRERDAAIQAIAYTLAPMHRLADMAANIEDVLFDCYNENGKAGEKYRMRLKALVMRMCPQSYDAIWETTFRAPGGHGAATDASSASATGHSAAEAIDVGNAAQELEALHAELVAADSTRGKLWEGSMPIATFATGS